jgi:hypothetical protein
MHKTEEVKSDSWEDKLSKKEEEWTRGREVWIYLRSLSGGGGQSSKNSGSSESERL